MKNMIKMSLVAAVAVAGLSSTVAAKPLEEAIKNVDVSGTVLYRYNDYSNDDGASGAVNYYKIATSIKAKVNDTITSTVRVVAANDDNDKVALKTGDSGDANPDVKISQANFSAKLGVATVIAGKQGLATPWTKAIDSDGSEQTGTGVLALVPVGPVTLAAGAFNQTNLDEADVAIGDGSEGLQVAAVMANVGPVAVDAWYIAVDNQFDSYTVGAKATFDMVTVDARHTSLDLDSVTTDNSLSYVKVSAKLGAVTAWANYAMTDKDGGTVALQGTAKTTMLGWSTQANEKADADMFMVGAKMDVMSGLNVSLNYNKVDYTAGNEDAEESEVFTQITHTMGKNFSTYVRFGQYEKDLDSDATEKVDGLRGRLQVEYKF